ncbi:MAG: polysaccharide pyruvyl transferase family protein [Planctomycetota bacterium]|jgi:hypothetical protein
MRTLVAGWFSFEGMGATAGDLAARDLVRDWLDRAGREHDVALAAPFEGGVDWRTVDAAGYDQVVFVCGPFGNGPPLTDLLRRFAHCRLVGVNVSMLDPLEAWNPFDLLLERDSSAAARPDVSFLAREAIVPVAGIVLVAPQREYGARARHPDAEAAIRRLLDARPAAAIPIDTRLDANATGLRTAAEVESAIARMDLVITTRLHGTVLALKHGVPALPIDPIAGGAKILRQVETIGWPLRFTADALDDAALARAFDYCLTDEARREARRCADEAARAVEAIRDRFVAGMREAPVADDP